MYQCLSPPIQWGHQATASNVIKMIRRLSQDEKANWPKHLPELIQAYNGMRSAIMGYSPHYLLFGYHPRFPIDLHFPTI